MSSVNELFFKAVKVAASGVPVAMPNIKFDPTGLDKYYQIFIVPARKVAVGLSDTDAQTGFCQVSCFVKTDVGEIKVLNMAESIISAFPRGTRLTDNVLKVEINQPSYYSQGLTNNNGWYMVPVTIPYIVLT